MKRYFCLAALLCGLASTPSHAAVIITEVMASSSHPSGNGNGDWFELFNSGDTPINLAGWSWDDDSNLPGTSLFPAITLNPGKYVIVLDEDAGNTADWVTNVWGVQSLVDNGTLTMAGNLNTFPGLSATGDTIYIYDASNTVVTSLTFGTSTQGFSLAWTQLGSPLETSVAGVDGAFVAPEDGAVPPAPGTDVGSPGFAVIPEPGTLALTIFGVTLGFVALRRRRVDG